MHGATVKILPYSRIIPGLVSVQGLSTLPKIHNVISLSLHVNSIKTPELRLQNFPSTFSPSRYSLTISLTCNTVQPDLLTESLNKT